MTSSALPNASLDGAVAIVTGAGRGIGRVIAQALAHRGAKVALAARSGDELDRLVAELRAEGASAIALPTDVSNSAAVDAMVAATVTEWGRLDVLVNNAGVIRYAPITETSPEDWDAILGTNLRGTFLCTRAAFGVMGRGGSIINVASTFGNAPVRGYAAYCASKAAILHFTRVAALEGAPLGIRINALAPGYVETELNADALADPAIRGAIERRVPLGRIATPDELLPLVVFLASGEAAYVTGSVFTIDGGFALR